MKQIVSLRQRLVAFFLLWLALSAASAHTSPGRPAGPATPPLAQALTPDGSLQPGAHGSFDATGYAMTTAPDGHPVFQPTRPQRTAGAGDANWADGFGVPGTSGNVYALAADGSGNLYAGGDFTVAGGVTANHVAKWNGSAWAALGTGTNYSINALAADGSGNLYAGGYFTTAGWRPVTWPSGTAALGRPWAPG